LNPRRKGSRSPTFAEATFKINPIISARGRNDDKRKIRVPIPYRMERYHPWSWKRCHTFPEQFIITERVKKKKKNRCIRKRRNWSWQESEPISMLVKKQKPRDRRKTHLRQVHVGWGKDVRRANSNVTTKKAPVKRIRRNIRIKKVWQLNRGGRISYRGKENFTERSQEITGIVLSSFLTIIRGAKTRGHGGSSRRVEDFR